MVENSTKVAVYPGTFDPVTLGHMDVITRGAGLFDKVVVAVAINVSKTSLFTAEERVTFLKEATEDIANVEVCQMDGLLVDFINEINACTILRGLRAISDFEVEFQMAAMNRKLSAKAETVFLMASESTTFISSRLVKEVAGMGGNIDRFVPTSVVLSLREKMDSKRRG
ncbi:MAG: pantetheine-phosphate adenylyltransferase [Magnetococcales bacterium]|nr:pantetheine-phosphate adenylyltransferase [Magnetococcales bacterium]